MEDVSTEYNKSNRHSELASDIALARALAQRRVAGDIPADGSSFLTPTRFTTFGITGLQVVVAWRTLITASATRAQFTGALTSNLCGITTFTTIIQHQLQAVNPHLFKKQEI